MGKNKINLFFCVYFFFWLSSNALEPYLGVFYEDRGLTGTQIGMASGLFSAASVLAALLSGVLADRIGKPRYVTTALIAGMVVCTALLYACSGAAAILLCVFLYGCFYSPVNGIVDKALLDALKDQSTRFSSFRTGGTLGAAIGVVLAGLLFKGAAFLPLFIVFWSSITLCGVCAWSMPQESSQTFDKPRLRDYRALAKSRYFIPIYATMALWGITESGMLQFMALHIMGSGYDAKLTSLFICAAMLGEFLLFLCMPRLSGRLRERRLLGLAFALQFLRIGTLTFVAYIPLPITVFFQFTGGGAFAILFSVITEVIGRVFPANTGYCAQSLKQVANRGIGVVTGSLLLGTLFDLQRLAWGYMILMLLALALTVYYLLPIRKDQVI